MFSFKKINQSYNIKLMSIVTQFMCDNLKELEKLEKLKIYE